MKCDHLSPRVRPSSPEDTCWLQACNLLLRVQRRWRESLEGTKVDNFILHCALVPCCPLYLSSRVLLLSVYTKVEDGAIIRLSRLFTVLVELALLAFGIVSGTLRIPVGLMWHLPDVQVMV